MMTHQVTVAQTAEGDWQLPGIANLHSHAFQRAMAGMAERMTRPADSFWTWREVMYGMAQAFTPEHLHAVASQLYVEMLEAGYTHVCEFHYLHHRIGGHPHAPASAMSDALLQAANDVGIGMTLLPVLYMQGGFDGRALDARQARFAHEVDDYLRLLDDLRVHEGRHVRIGCALHSLRAVPESAMKTVLAHLPADAPVHIHIAEQVAEVEDCLQLRGARPVDWLLDHAPVDARWTLVHATHLSQAEVQRIAASGATVAICTTTEANLGDGFFPFQAYRAAGGHWGVGSDSHISVSPVEELRWLEYGQRLLSRRRNIAADMTRPSVGDTLVAAALHSAPASTGLSQLDPGKVTLDGRAPVLVGATPNDLLDRWVFAGNVPVVRAVESAGQLRVAEGRHLQREAVAERFRVSMAALRAG